MFHYFVYSGFALLHGFLSCGEKGLLSNWGHLLTTTPCCGAQALGPRASVVVVHRLSCSMSCEIFPEQG